MPKTHRMKLNKNNNHGNWLKNKKVKTQAIKILKVADHLNSKTHVDKVNIAVEFRYQPFNDQHNRLK